MLLLSFVLAGREALRGLTRLLTALAGGVLLLGVVPGFRGLTGAGVDLTLSLVQRLLDQPQHEIPLGELAARAGSLSLQVRLDPLEKVLSDLEGHRAGAVVVRHDLVTSIFLHFVIIDEQVGDVLRGGQARLLSGLADALVQLQG